MKIYEIFFNEFCEKFPNQVSMGNEPLVIFLKKNYSFQTNKNKLYSWKDAFNFQKLHVQRVFQKPYNTPALCWAFYYVNNNKRLNGKFLKVICCILCYNSRVNASSLVRIETKKTIKNHITKPTGITYGHKPCYNSKKIIGLFMYEDFFERWCFGFCWNLRD
jgi:hypothetical protein